MNGRVGHKSCVGVAELATCDAIAFAKSFIRASDLGRRSTATHVLNCIRLTANGRRMHPSAGLLSYSHLGGFSQAKDQQHSGARRIAHHCRLCQVCLVYAGQLEHNHVHAFANLIINWLSFESIFLVAPRCTSFRSLAFSAQQIRESIKMHDDTISEHHQPYPHARLF